MSEEKATKGGAYRVVVALDAAEDVIDLFERHGPESTPSVHMGMVMTAALAFSHPNTQPTPMSRQQWLEMCGDFWDAAEGRHL